MLLHAYPEDAPQIPVVGLLREFQRPDIFQIIDKSVGEVLTELVESCFFLHFEYIAEVFVFARQVLPGESPLSKKYQYIPKAFQIVAATCLVAFVDGDACEPCCSFEDLALLKGDVIFGVFVFVSFSKAKVDDVYPILVLSLPHHKIRGLNIIMQKILRVDELDPMDQLVSDH